MNCPKCLSQFWDGTCAYPEDCYFPPDAAEREIREILIPLPDFPDFYEEALGG